MNAHEFKIQVFPLKDKLFRFALRLLKNREEAEDVTQEILMRLWNRNHELDKYDNVEAFAMQAVKNLCMDKLKKRQMRYQKIDLVRHSQEKYHEDDHLERNEMHAIIQMVINKLPEQQKMVIHLRDVEGYSTKEIESILNMEENAIRTNLSRARKKVRDQISKIMNYGL